MSGKHPVQNTISHTLAGIPPRALALWRRSVARVHPRSRRVSMSFQWISEQQRWMVAARGYLAAVVGVAVVSLFIALTLRWVHISNISLVYLLVVLALAATYGRGPAIFASLLSFLAYDFFFIRPVYLFTVYDPTEWLSLLALLATSLVLGQLTATVRRRADEAVESQRRTAVLYSLAQLVVTTTEQERLYTALVRRVVDVFSAQGVRACALVLRGEPALVQTQAVASTEDGYTAALALDRRDNAGLAQWALDRGTTVGGTRPGSEGADVQVYFVPVRSGRRILGVLGIAGTPEIRGLIPPATIAAPQMEYGREDGHEQQVVLFAAFCDQIALALDRSALQREAIHAEALRESDQLKDVLLGSVTHDLRTPLASIKAAVSSLLQPDMTWSEQERREFLTSIDSSADRLNRLVGNLLDLSRLEAGSTPPQKDWYLIGDVVATVLDRLDLTGQTQGYHIAVDIPDDIPLVPMDYAQIEEVLTNLVENALKYSPAGSEIRIAARTSSPSELEVRVRDQGVGIPANELTAIFDKFYRVQHVQLPWAMTRPPIGTGLGLAICQAIVRAHGGRIWAESVLGQGATFIFTLPIPAERPGGTLPEVESVAPRESAQTASKGAI